MTDWILVALVGLVWFVAMGRFTILAHWAEPDWPRLTFWLVSAVGASVILGSLLERVLP